MITSKPVAWSDLVMLLFYTLFKWIWPMNIKYSYEYWRWSMSVVKMQVRHAVCCEQCTSSYRISNSLQMLVACMTKWVPQKSSTDSRDMKMHSPIQGHFNHSLLSVKSFGWHVIEWSFYSWLTSLWYNPFQALIYAVAKVWSQCQHFSQPKHSNNLHFWSR